MVYQKLKHQLVSDRSNELRSQPSTDTASLHSQYKISKRPSGEVTMLKSTYNRLNPMNKEQRDLIFQQ